MSADDRVIDLWCLPISILVTVVFQCLVGKEMRQHSTARMARQARAGLSEFVAVRCDERLVLWAPTERLR